MDVQDILSLHQTVLPKASVTDAERSYARMNFTSNSILGKTPKFVDMGLSPAHKTDKLKSLIGTATRYGGLTDHSDWLASMHSIVEVTEVRVRKVHAYSNYI